MVWSFDYAQDKKIQREVWFNAMQCQAELSTLRHRRMCKARLVTLFFLKGCRGDVLEKYDLSPHKPDSPAQQIFSAAFWEECNYRYTSLRLSISKKITVALFWK